MDIGTLDRAGPETDYHGLIERVAYRIWQGCRNHADWCWGEAKRKILVAADIHNYGYKFWDPYSFHQCLQQEAFHIKNEQPHISTIGAWYAALDKHADLVMAVAMY